MKSIMKARSLLALNLDGFSGLLANLIQEVWRYDRVLLRTNGSW